MNKKAFALLPFLAILLTGCKDGPIHFEKSSHEPGLFSSGSKVAEPGESSTISYEYFNGDALDSVSSLTQEVIEFDTDNSTLEFNKTEDILSYIKTGSSLVTSISEFSNTARNAKGIRVGTTKDNMNGKIVMQLAYSCKAFSITAKPYSTFVSDFEENKLVVDENCAISVNEKAYVKLDISVNSSNEVSFKQCNFVFTEPTSTLSITAIGQRSIISKITLYH